MKYLFYIILTFISITYSFGEVNDSIKSRSSISVNLFAPFLEDIQIDYRYYLIPGKLELTIKPKIGFIFFDNSNDLINEENGIQFYSIPIGLHYDVLKHLYTGVHVAPYLSRNLNFSLIDIYPVIGGRWTINNKILITTDIGYGLSLQKYSLEKKYTTEAVFCHMQIGLGIIINTNKKR